VPTSWIGLESRIGSGSGGFDRIQPLRLMSNGSGPAPATLPDMAKLYRATFTANQVAEDFSSLEDAWNAVTNDDAPGGHLVRHNPRRFDAVDAHGDIVATIDVIDA
jgi:hypothetical protein